ncbi:uncharacterized protein EI97DRAFT_428804 [Westerdykella ornata]|uniref:FAR-17a/AIG1-like protein n=1 Tax=Westerdykella ornata TaxID=318751 RepID=A0A6A6JXZ2_WESOR|nr:uncharacterized protein EI97DRAFT_428804 [Westerdykella ornata]KAF2280698.1 hypothetical protein EI97DRAFT_428804 [Westerdykella ornata]
MSETSERPEVERRRQKQRRQIQARERQRHPLQKFESPSKGFSGVVHVVGLWNFYVGFKYLADNPNFITTSFGWHLQYLTILGLSISTLCFSVGLLADMTGSYALFTAKNYLSLVAAPIEILIALLYWGFRAVDPALVVPPDLPLPPLSIDCAFHLFPALLLALDALLLSPPWPTTPTHPRAPLITLGLTTGFAVAYWIWLEVCYARNGWYPYPILELLTVGQRVGLFAGAAAGMGAVGMGLRVWYGWINGVERHISSKLE